MLLKEKNDVEVEDVIGPCKVSVQDYKYTAVCNHCRCYLHCRDPPCSYQQNYQSSACGEKKRGIPEFLGRPGPPKMGLLQMKVVTLLHMETPWA